MPTGDTAPCGAYDEHPLVQTHRWRDPENPESPTHRTFFECGCQVHHLVDGRKRTYRCEAREVWLFSGEFAEWRGPSSGVCQK